MSLNLQNEPVQNCEFFNKESVNGKKSFNEKVTTTILFWYSLKNGECFSYYSLSRLWQCVLINL